MENTKVKFFFKSKKAFDANDKPIMVQEVKEKSDKDGNKSTEALFNKDGSPVMVQQVIPAPEPLEVEIPLLTPQDIIEIFNGSVVKNPETGVDETVVDEKQVKLILESANATILEQARVQVNSEDMDVRNKGLDLSALTWSAIANLPPAQRRGSAISEEKWEAFTKDYIEVMQHHGKTEEKAKAGAKLLVKRYQAVKNNKKVIAALKGNLQVWFTNTSEEMQREMQEIYETLMSKADSLLEADEDAILAAV